MRKSVGNVVRMMHHNSVGDYRKLAKRLGHPLKIEDQVEWLQTSESDVKRIQFASQNQVSGRSNPTNNGC